MSSRKRRLTESGGTPGSNSDQNRSKQQRVANVTQILDIAKESTDWFPPLESALSGVIALVERYEQFEDVKGKIRGLKPQLDRLKQTVTTTTKGDPEETGRREELASALEEIEKRSRELLAKGTVTQFVNKKGDSKEVARLAERLQEAINHYQISQRQAVYNQIANLTSSLDTLLKLHEKSPTVKNKLDSVMARLDRLCSEEDNDGGLCDDNGHEHRAKLSNTLRLIGDDGNVLYNRTNAQGYRECQDDIQAASAMVDDIRDVIVDYQMAQQRAIYDKSCRLIDVADLLVLNSCRRAHGAGYQRGDRRGCLRGTRETVLNEIESWAKDFEKSPVFWLNGLAGTGKSTITKTISERVFASGLLGASFFCSRDFEDRSDLHLIFPTLAFQLAHKYPTFRSVLVPLLRSNPDIVYESLMNQMGELIVEPLKLAGVWMVIVIDALDECKDEEPQSAILSVLGRFVERIPKVKFFITGRPEPRIKDGFRLPMLVNLTDVFVLHNFLDTSTRLPERQLDAIVNFPEHTGHEGKTRFNPKTSLDSLYASILKTGFGEEDLEVDSKVRSTIGAVVLLVNPLPSPAIAELIGLDSREITRFLTLLQSLLAFDEESNQPAKPFHKSFPDFVTDPSRCVDTRFWISPKILHLELAMNCLRVMNDTLERNLLSLPDYALNSEVKDLETRVNDRISDVLRYACRSWHSHLTKTEGGVTDVISRLRVFLEEKFLVWLEVVSVLGGIRGAIAGLEQLILWLQEAPRNEELLDTARDYSHFVVAFFEPISVSATHIYHSALELSPLSSIIRRRYYHQRHTYLPRVIAGARESWERGIIIPSKNSCLSYTWSPCGQFIAAQSREAVEIYDSISLELLSTLKLTGPTPDKVTSLLAYSTDGRSIASLSGTSLVIWDIQTGGVAKETDYGGARSVSMMWSLDGSTIGIMEAKGRRSKTYIVHTYDVSSGATHSPGTLESTNKPRFWAYGTSFRIVTAERAGQVCTINIFEVGSILTKIESFHIELWEKSRTRTIGSFSQTTHRVSYLLSNPNHLVVSDIRDSHYLLQEGGLFYSHCFSSDGSLFAASQWWSLHVWKYTSNHYVRWREFSILDLTIGLDFLRFSPTSSSLLGCVDGVPRVWRLDSPSIGGHRGSDEQVVILSCCGSYVVAGHKGNRAVIITDLLSQTTLCVIDTGVVIEELALAGNILLARGSKIIVTWRLTGEGIVDGVLPGGRAGRSNSIWTIPVQSSWPCLYVRDQTAVICERGNVIHAYHTETGEVLEPVQPNSRGRYHSWGGVSLDELGEYGWGTPPEGGGLLSWNTFREGWVKDLEGNHLLWLPIEWRNPKHIASRSYDSTVVWLDLGRRRGGTFGIVIIKF
ncbi:hypothetical protein BDM02DRAFT_3186299 [Thelephora ganbajun]|uniref:Uncharacterized protein n=1 Tax=Thelephora ganbajun TaxID=370292 RepID=A0ACB6ZIA2_THEGA|nr:hypothetical protein BDM02DRAFT_3186299 [Thelephora ganbajun]